MFEMMVRAPFRLCQLAVPGMLERGQGWILNITSKQAAQAAVLLCGAPPGTLTGRVAYSMELLGRPLPNGPWALSETF